MDLFGTDVDEQSQRERWLYQTVVYYVPRHLEAVTRETREG